MLVLSLQLLFRKMLNSLIECASSCSWRIDGVSIDWFGNDTSIQSEMAKKYLILWNSALKIVLQNFKANYIYLSISWWKNARQIKFHVKKSCSKNKRKKKKLFVPTKSHVGQFEFVLELQPKTIVTFVHKKFSCCYCFKLKPNF